jgi:hypothetical protein
MGFQGLNVDYSMGLERWCSARGPDGYSSMIAGVCWSGPIVEVISVDFG